MRLWKGLSPIVLLILHLSCQGSKESDEHTRIEGDVREEAVKPDELKVEPESIPSVVLRDEVGIWENENGKLSSRPLTLLDLGQELVYLSSDEELSAGNNSYRYSHVRLDDGIEGWVSTFRLAKNAIAATVVEQVGLYGKPLITTPVNRILPSGQVVAVSLDKGIVNGFVEISFSFYEDGSISNPETYYIEFETLSVDEKDLNAAQLVLKAFRLPEQRDDFFALAASLESIFDSFIYLGDDSVIYEDYDTSSPTIENRETSRLLAINPHTEGNAEDWYAIIDNDELLGWTQSDSTVTNQPLRKMVVQRPSLKDKSVYFGNGVPAVNLYQNISLRKKVADEQGNETLVAFESLEMGEIVYASDQEMAYDGVDYIFVESPNGYAGWSSKTFIVTDSKAAVVIKNDVRVFDDTRLTALTTIKLSRLQLLAVSNQRYDGFLKISFIDRNNGKLHTNLYIQSNQQSFSFEKNDVDGAILLEKMLDEKDEEMAALYHQEFIKIPSFFQHEVDILPEAEAVSE